MILVVHVGAKVLKFRSTQVLKADNTKTRHPLKLAYSTGKSYSLKAFEAGSEAFIHAKMESLNKQTFTYLDLNPHTVLKHADFK
jgi:hypothetical protein